MADTNTSFPDRRKKRSDKLQKAVTYQLEHVVEQSDLDWLAVGDSDGLYVAGAGEETEDDLLAAFAPALSEADGSTRDALERELTELLDEEDDSSVDVRTFEVGETTWHLCMVHSRPEQADSTLDHTMTGIQRIFRTTRA